MALVVTKNVNVVSKVAKSNFILFLKINLIYWIKKSLKLKEIDIKLT